MHEYYRHNSISTLSSLSGLSAMENMIEYEISTRTIISSPDNIIIRNLDPSVTIYYNTHLPYSSMILFKLLFRYKPFY